MVSQTRNQSIADPTQLPPDWLKDVVIRRLEESDLPALEWNGEYTHFRKMYSDAFVRQQRGFSVLWLAELSGFGIIGQVFIQLICDRHELADGLYRAYLYSFRIKPPFRNAGLGGKMLTILETDLVQRHFHYLTLNVAKVNNRARKMYERHGFRIVEHEPGCWSYIDHEGNWQQVEEPAWRMEKIIP